MMNQPLNTNLFGQQLVTQMKEAEMLDKVIRQNLEVLGYGQ